MKTKTLILFATLLVLAFAAGCQPPGERTSGAPLHDPHDEHGEPPTVDPSWPRLPDDWLIGEVGGSRWTWTTTSGSSIGPAA